MNKRSESSFWRWLIILLIFVFLKSIPSEQTAQRNDSQNSQKNSTAEYSINTKNTTKIESFIHALGSLDQNIRETAAYELGKIGDRSIIPKLIKGLSSDIWNRRAGSALALGELKAKRAVNPLIHALGDENWRVRWKAEEALKKITGQDFGEKQAQWRRWWQRQRK